ncbi:sigma-70 family RNA polymerase sigma factor [Oscillospiraceae bacterium PP1C4]
MFGRSKKAEAFFDRLCEEYYERILRYLYSALGDEGAARDTTQEVFLTACGKRELLMQHPNAGGFLFQTAKNLVKKVRREGFVRMAHEQMMDDESGELIDRDGSIEWMLDRQIDEQDYIEEVLSRLSPEKRKLYGLYYLQGRKMGEIAAEYHVDEVAVRMRYVRLRREIKDIAAEVAEQKFYG